MFPNVSKSYNIMHQILDKITDSFNLQQQALLTTGDESGDYSYFTQSVIGE